MGSLYCYNCRYSYTSSVDELMGCKWEVCIATLYTCSYKPLGWETGLFVQSLKCSHNSVIIGLQIYRAHLKTNIMLCSFT